MTSCWRSTANWSRATASIEGMVYLQVTRGDPGDRDFAFPDPETTPSTLVLFTQDKPGLADNPAAKTGMQGDLDPRHPLGPARHQDGAAAVPVDGQDDGQEGRGR